MGLWKSDLEDRHLWAEKTVESGGGQNCGSAFSGDWKNLFFSFLFLGTGDTVGSGSVRFYLKNGKSGSVCSDRTGPIVLLLSHLMGLGLSSMGLSLSLSLGSRNSMGLSKALLGGIFHIPRRYFPSELLLLLYQLPNSLHPSILQWLTGRRAA